MPVAARKPQASSPNDSIQIFDTLDAEFISIGFDVRIPVNIDDSLDIEIESFLAGTAEFIALDDEITIENSLLHFYLNNIEFADVIDVDVYQNFTEQLKEFQVVEEVDNSDAIGRLDGLELDLVLSSTSPAFFKEFVYNLDSLTGYNVYKDASKVEQLYSVVFSFSGEDLTSKTITRLSDGKQLIVGFNYSDGNLVSQSRTLV